MSTTTVLSGTGAAVDGVSTAFQWSAEVSAELQAYRASNTFGATGRVKGNKDWSGSYSAYGGEPAVMPGDAFNFVGSIDGADGITGPARVSQIELTWNIEEGSILSHTVSFEGNGVVTRGTSEAEDVTIPDVPSSIDTKLEIAPLGGSFTEVEDVRSMALTITAENQSYASSSTSGTIKREKGNIDFTGSYSLYTDDFANFPAENTDHMLRLYTNATEYWELKWVKVAGHSDLEANKEDANIVAGTVNFEMNGFNPAATPDLEAATGYIKRPSEMAGSEWWKYIAPTP